MTARRLSRVISLAELYRIRAARQRRAFVARAWAVVAALAVLGWLWRVP